MHRDAPLQAERQRQHQLPTHIPSVNILNYQNSTPKAYHDDIGGADDDRIHVLDVRAVRGGAHGLGEVQGAQDGGEEGGYEDEDAIADLRDGRGPGHAGGHAGSHQGRMASAAAHGPQRLGGVESGRASRLRFSGGSAVMACTHWVAFGTQKARRW